MTLDSTTTQLVAERQRLAAEFQLDELFFLTRLKKSVSELRSEFSKNSARMKKAVSFDPAAILPSSSGLANGMMDASEPLKELMVCTKTIANAQQVIDLMSATDAVKDLPFLCEKIRMESRAICPSYSDGGTKDSSSEESSIAVNRLSDHLRVNGWNAKLRAVFKCRKSIDEILAKNEASSTSLAQGTSLTQGAGSSNTLGTSASSNAILPGWTSRRLVDSLQTLKSLISDLVARHPVSRDEAFGEIYDLFYLLSCETLANSTNQSVSSTDHSVSASLTRGVHELLYCEKPRTEFSTFLANAQHSCVGTADAMATAFLLVADFVELHKERYKTRLVSGASRSSSSESWTVVFNKVRGVVEEYVTRLLSVLMKHVRQSSAVSQKTSLNLFSQKSDSSDGLGGKGIGGKASDSKGSKSGGGIKSIGVGSSGHDASESETALRDTDMLVDELASSCQKLNRYKQYVLEVLHEAARDEGQEKPSFAPISLSGSDVLIESLSAMYLEISSGYIDLERSLLLSLVRRAIKEAEPTEVSLQLGSASSGSGSHPSSASLSGTCIARGSTIVQDVFFTVTTRCVARSLATLDPNAACALGNFVVSSLQQLVKPAFLTCLHNRFRSFTALVSDEKVAGKIVDLSDSLDQGDRTKGGMTSVGFGLGQSGLGPSGIGSGLGPSGLGIGSTGGLSTLVVKGANLNRLYSEVSNYVRAGTATEDSEDSPIRLVRRDEPTRGQVHKGPILTGRYEGPAFSMGDIGSTAAGGASNDSGDQSAFASIGFAFVSERVSFSDLVVDSLDAVGTVKELKNFAMDQCAELWAPFYNEHRCLDPSQETDAQDKSDAQDKFDARDKLADKALPDKSLPLALPPTIVSRLSVKMYTELISSSFSQVEDEFEEILVFACKLVLQGFKSRYVVPQLRDMERSILALSSRERPNAGREGPSDPKSSISDPKSSNIDPVIATNEFSTSLNGGHSTPHVDAEHQRISSSFVSSLSRMFSVIGLLFPKEVRIRACVLLADQLSQRLMKTVEGISAKASSMPDAQLDMSKACYACIAAIAEWFLENSEYDPNVSSSFRKPLELASSTVFVIGGASRSDGAPATKHGSASESDLDKEV